MVNVNTLHLIFPETHRFLCELIIEGLERMLEIACKQTNYNLYNLNLENIYQISKILDETSILILAYCDEMPSESFYKLGMAFKQKSIILINIIQSNIQKYPKVPHYVKKDFLLLYLESQNGDLANNVRQLILDLTETINIILANDLNELLYHEALGYCKNLEKSTDINIIKVDRDEFIQRLMGFQDKKGSEILNQLYINKSSELYIVLLSCIAFDKFEMYTVLTVAQNLQKGDHSLDDRTPYKDMRDIAKLAVSRPIINKAEAKAMSENPQFTNNLQGANIANFANEVKDNASQQASNFNQTSGANINEILQLIGNLRQTAAQFSPEIRDDIIIDIDDVEVEIKKPEKERNLPKLKKRLIALGTAATVTFAGVAGMADFANNVMEIGNKLNIELPLISGK